MILRASLVLLLCLADVGVAGAAGGSNTFSDYPRYGTDVNTLPPAVQSGMKAFATALVGAVLAGQSVDVSVFGHADFDAKGRTFELEVSRQRALGAEAALITFFNQAADAAALPADRRKAVRFASMGLGTLRPVFPAPANEDQRKANRRVEVVWTTTPVPPPDPRTKFERCVRVLASASPPGPVRRMTCICTKLLQSSPAVKDYYYDYRAALLARAGAGDMSHFTTEQMNALYRGFMPFVRQQINAITAGPDADFSRGLLGIDDAIGRGLNDFMSQAEQRAGLFELTVSQDIAKRMLDPNHIYSCYAGYSRRDPDR